MGGNGKYVLEIERSRGRGNWGRDIKHERRKTIAKLLGQNFCQREQGSPLDYSNAGIIFKNHYFLRCLKNVHLLKSKRSIGVPILSFLKAHIQQNYFHIIV